MIVFPTWLLVILDVVAIAIMVINVCSLEIYLRLYERDLNEWRRRMKNKPS